MSLTNNNSKYDSNGNLNPFWVERENAIHNTEAALAYAEAESRAIELGRLEGQLAFVIKHAHVEEGEKDVFPLCCALLNLGHDAFYYDDEDEDED